MKTQKIIIPWTTMQGRAINERDADLLVSASAGSGKTTVMIERIAQMIEKHEATLDNILVLTFTNASSADMKAKLRRRLGEADMREEQPIIPNETVGTFHKYCLQLVRTNFSTAGVNASFEVMDETEAAFSKSEVLDELIANNYEKYSDVIDIFCTGRNIDVFKKTIISVVDFLDSRSDGDKWLETIAFAGYEENFAKNVAMRQILDHYNRVGEYYKVKFENSLTQAHIQNATRAIPHIIQCLEASTALLLMKNWTDIHKFANEIHFDSLNSATGKGFDGYKEFQIYRNDFKKITDKIAEHYNISEVEIQHSGKRDRSIVKSFVGLVKQFNSMYTKVKLKDNKLDFADLEKYATIVLADPLIAAAECGKYKYIFIDEYQDTNPMQERILSLISGTRNIFMVGDVKQSIYGFRGCEATIFAGKMTDFETNLSGKVVKLNENFRSNPEILKFVNAVFGKIMKEDLADINYEKTSRFNIGAAEPSEVPPVEILLVDTSSQHLESAKVTEVYDITKDNTSSAESKAAKAQSILIADKITKLLKTKIWDAKAKCMRPVNPNDIAILSRSRTHFDVLLETLARADIDATVTAEQNTCELFEIALLNNMLFAVSNFYNDVPLVLTMQSFVFNFTPDDIAEIKLKSDKEECYYNRIINYINNNTDDLATRLTSFVAFLEKYNVLSKKRNTADVLTIFLTEYKILDKFLLDAKTARWSDNIQSFISKLRTFAYANTVARYLYYLENDLVEIKINQNSARTDSVQVMTMHASKGLEFPIVIIYDAGADFNKNDIRQFLVVDKTCGLCVYSTDTEQLVKTNSVARLGAVISKNRVMIAEEMRLFYVALTRAKNHLIIVGAGKIENLGNGFDYYDIYSAKSYLNFLSPTILGNKGQDCTFKLTVTPLASVHLTKHNETPRTPNGLYDKDLTNHLKKIYTQPYQYENATRIIYKNSVSSLTKTANEQYDIKYINDNNSDDENYNYGADYGTKFHKKMQAADFGVRHSDVAVQKCIDIIKPFINKESKIYKELAFLQNLNINEEEVLVQGVVDLLIVNSNHMVLVDYKTTHASESELVELYQPQLSMYAAAMTQALGLTDISIYIYSTVHEKLIKI